MNSFEKALAALAMSPMDHAARQHAERLTRHMDGIVEALVRERLPPHELEDFPRQLGRLVGRLEAFDDFSDHSRTFVLDGRPLVRFYAPTTTMDSGLLSVTMRYQVLA